MRKLEKKGLSVTDNLRILVKLEWKRSLVFTEDHCCQSHFCRAVHFMTTSSPISFHAALYAWLILYGAYGGELGNGEPIKLVFNIFDVAENLGLWVRSSISWRLLFFPFSPPLFILSHLLSWKWERTVSIVCVYIMGCLNSTSPVGRLCETPLPPLLLHGPGQITASSWCQDHILELVLANIPFNLNTLDSSPSHSYHTQSNLRSLFAFS